MPFETNKKIILDKLSKIEYTKGELERKLKNVKLSEKSRRKVLAQIENKRRGIRKESKEIKRARANSRSIQSKHKVASRSRANLKSEKTGSVKPSQKKDGFINGKKKSLKY